MIINPLFEFFDLNVWANKALYTKIFFRIFDYSKQNKNLEHFEVVLIDKFIEYLQNENKIYKNRTDRLVQKKVMKLLLKVIDSISYVYLSFLYIDVINYNITKIINIVENCRLYSCKDRGEKQKL